MAMRLRFRLNDECIGAMNTNRTISYRIATTLIAAFLSIQGLKAQKPEITEVDKVNGSMSEVVTLKGSSFGTDSTRLKVFFGAQKASIKSITNQLLEVSIPPGTTYDNISVTNTTAALTGYTRNQFLLSFNGKHPFDATNLGSQLNFDANSELYDHCLCDLNLDGKVDIATANKSSTSISILQNTSTGAGNISFRIPTQQFPIGAASLQIKCGDLNSDGRPDLVVTEGTAGINDRVFILQNTGAFTFSTQIIKLVGRKNSKIEIADLDLNGKPEVIITDQGSGRVSILVNQSVGAIAFAAPVDLLIPEAATTDGIAVEDLNGDGRPDLVTSQFGTSNSNLYIAPNTSIPGTVSFGAVSKITIDKTIRDIRIGDLDNDRKPDIAVTQFLGSSVSVLLNTSSGSTISFGPATVIPSDAAPWGLDFGDIDGDGKTDIAVASIASTNITLLNNQSTPGSLSFIKQSVPTTFITRHTRVGDLDGDGKPDISFCSVDKTGVIASKVSVFRNEACVVPEVTPANTPVSLCLGLLPYKLTATMSRGSYYQWLKDGVQVSCGRNQNTLDVTAAMGSGKYTVRIIGEGGNCTAAGNCGEESAGIDIVIGGASASATNPTSNGPVCIGSTLNLSLANPAAGATYKWTGPAGFTATGPAPTLPNFKLENAGRYSVEVTVGSCISSVESTVVEAIDAPTFQVAYTGSSVICQGDAAKVLSVMPSPGTYTYQWLKNGTPIGGATSATYSVSSVAASSGNYAVRASYSGCATFETTPVEIRVATLPVSAFTAPATACAGQKVTFTNQSTFDNTATVFYEWDFGDGQASDDEDPEHIFTGANTYPVILQVSYKDEACADTTKHKITITAAPPVAITNTANDYLMCEGETLALEVLGSFNSYSWSTGATGPSILITQSGTYTVDVTAPNGCVLTASRVVSGLPAPGVIVTATPQQINEGETSQLQASGLVNYEWEPADALSTSPTIADPVANPLETTIYIVTGHDANGCTGTATIEVTVIGDAIVSKLGPKNFFSPDNSGPNDLWTVDRIVDYPQCAVTIYDDKGVKVFDAKPYQNDWNGIFNGKPLPDGVYFYIIRCDGEENSPRTGSITLIR
jgi:gliding motility-associated-like protein